MNRHKDKTEEIDKKLKKKQRERQGGTEIEEQMFQNFILTKLNFFNFNFYF